MTNAHGAETARHRASQSLERLDEWPQVSEQNQGDIQVVRGSAASRQTQHGGAMSG